jgi:hypothetical protein
MERSDRFIICRSPLQTHSMINLIERNESTISIHLGSGLSAVIDAPNEHLATQHHWFAVQKGRKIVAVTWLGGKTVYMHRLVYGGSGTHSITHINGNGLDNRVANLRVLARSEEAARARFFDKIEKNVAGDHWLWIGQTARGYGRFTVHGTTRQAHRIMYEMLHGHIPNGQVIRHLCNVSACVNPAHLRAGTQLENISDKVRARRCAAGEACGRTKLSDKQVDEILRLSGFGIHNAELARRFSVSRTHIGRLTKRTSRVSSSDKYGAALRVPSASESSTTSAA